jgi:hypothetical protein
MIELVSDPFFLPRARLFCVSTVSILVAMAGVSVPTVKRLEAADGLLGGREDTGIKLCGALERAGIEFTNGKQPGVHLRKRGRKT